MMWTAICCTCVVVHIEYFMESARVRCLHTSCGVSELSNKWAKRTSEISDTKQRVCKHRTTHFPCGIIMFVIYILRLNTLLKLWQANSPRQELSILTIEEMRIKTIKFCSLQTCKAMACALYETAPTSLECMKTSTCRTAHTWKNMIRSSWLDVSLFSHVGKAIRDIWLVYIGLRTKIYSAAFQCVNLSM